MSWVAVAIGGSALLGYMGSQNASNAMSSATNSANTLSAGQYTQNRRDMMPWMQRGNAAGNMLAFLMGLPGYGPRNAGPWRGTTINGTLLPPGGSMGSALNGATLPPPSSIGGPKNNDASIAYDTAFQNDPFNAGPSQSSLPPNIANVIIRDNDAFQAARPDLYPNAPGVQNGGWDPSGMDPNAYGSLSRRFGMNDFQTDPGSMFRLSEGYKALQRSGAAKGLALSGAQAKALTEYGQNFASNEYSNAYNRFTNDQANLFNRLSGIAGTGQQANQFVGTMGSNMANTVGGNLMNLGAGNAANYLTTANNMSGALNQGVNMWNRNNMWNQLMSRNG